MTSSNGNIFRVTCHLCGEFTGPRGIPTQRPVSRSFYVFFDLRPINGWVNTGEAGDLRRYRAHYDVTVILLCSYVTPLNSPEDPPPADKIYGSLIFIWVAYKLDLTNRGRDKMAAIFEAKISIVFSWMKMYEFRWIIHWSLSLHVSM